MSNRRIAPISIVVFVIGAAALVGAALLIWLRPGLNGKNSVEANDAIPFAARMDRIDGDVGIARQTSPEVQPYQGWSKTTLNAPVSLGDRIYVKSGSKAAIAFSGRTYARLNPETALDVVALTQGRTQLALRQGTCEFAVGDLDSGEVFEVGTPNGAVDFAEPGLYQVGIDDEGDTVVSVLSGLANVSGLAGSGEVSKGQLLTLAAAEAAEAVISSLSPDVAGTIVNDYYSYRYPTTYDGRYADYNTYAEDPFYYEESYRRSASYQYLSDDTEIAGLDDLDDYGDWEEVPNHGHCWRPRNTSADWAPYRDGYWSHDYPVGLTWVSNERWGWAPYHYGRWTRVNQGWYWVPEEAVRRPVYAPALVAFVPLPRADEIGWVPLGPGDPYVPRYYDRDYQPRYIGSRSNVEQYQNVTDIVNFHDPAAVTVVSISQFTRVITPATVVRPDAAYLAGTRLSVDPFAVPVLKQLAPTMEASKPVMPVPVEVHQVLARPIVVRQQSGTPAVPANIAETLKVQAIPEDTAKRKLKVKNSGESVVATKPSGLPALAPQAKVGQLTEQERQARIAALSAQAAQGNKAAKREMRQLEEQQRQQAAQQALAQQQQQAEQRKAEKQAARAQTQQAEQQRQAQASQEAEQRKAQKQARAQAQQAEQQRQAQAAQQAEQRKAQKQAARTQAQQAEQQRQAQATQEAQQRKAQKREARQQPQQAEQQAAQQAEQRKAQKQAARQQAQQAEQQRQVAQQAEQRKAEKRAAQQAEQQRQAQAAQQVEQQRSAQKQAARQQAQQAEQQRQSQPAQQAAQQAEQRKAQKQADQQQAQQEAARQQAQREQQRIQTQAQQQAQQQREQQKAEKRAQRQNPPPQQQQQQQSQPQVNPGKAERKAEKAKNKNKNSSP